MGKNVLKELQEDYLKTQEDLKERESTVQFDKLFNYKTRDYQIDNIIKSSAYRGDQGNSKYKLSVEEFNEAPYIVERIDKITDYLHSNESFLGNLDLATVDTGSKDRPSEVLRDQSNRLSTMINHRSILKDAPEDIKKAMREVRDVWENKTEVKGFIEGLGATGDYTIDALGNWEMIPVLLSMYFSKGAAAVPINSIKQSFKKSLSAKMSDKFISGVSWTGNALDTKKGLALYGLTTGLMHGDQYQRLGMAYDPNQKYNIYQTLFEGGLSAGATVAFGKGLPAAAGFVKRQFVSNTESKRLQNKLETTPDDGPLETQLSFDFMDDISVQEQLDLVDPVIANLTDEVVTDLDLEKLVIELEAAESKLINQQLEFDSEDEFYQPNLDLDFEKIDSSINNFVERIGAGKETQEEISDEVQDILASNLSPKEKVNKIKFTLHKIGSDITGKLIGGKAPNILTPYIKFSPTAKKLRSLLAHEFSEEFKIGTPQQKRIGKDFFEVARQYTGNVNDRFFRIMQPLSLSKQHVNISDEVTEQLNIAIRGGKVSNPEINKVALQIRTLFKEMGDVLENEGLIDKQVENYIPRMWNRKTIENNKDEFIDLLIQSGQSKNRDEALELFDSLLDIKNQIGSTGSGHFFSAQRKLVDIKDDAMFAKFFNQDFVDIFHQYTFQAGKALAKKKVFKATNASEFEKIWIDKIAKEMKDAGKTLSAKERTDILKLYKITTGEMKSAFGDRAQTGFGLYTLLNRMAYLSESTLSSLGEIFINVSKAGLLQSSKGFAQALELGFKTAFGDAHSRLVTKNGLTVNEAWSELRRFNVAVDQSISQIDNRLTGDALDNKLFQNTSNKFFKLTLLDQWTRFVQTVSFASGKNAIQRDIRTIALRGSRASSRRVNTAKGRLRELDIDIDDAVRWYNSGANLDDAFYKNGLLNGAARYTNSVILQPNAMSNLKPLWHSHPNSNVLFGLLSYPTAFSNTVLKGGLKQLIKTPETAANVAIASLLMLNTARFTNYVRTRGESENKAPHEIYKDAVTRIGGFGIIVDQVERARNNVKYMKNPFYYLGIPFGPAGTDTVGLFDKQNIIEFAGKKVPFWTSADLIFGKDASTSYSDMLKEADKSFRDIIIPERDFNNKGGIINIPRAATEPDERVDKMTGIPYNEQAGDAFTDILDREKRTGLSFGGTLISKALAGPLARQLDDATNHIFENKIINETSDNLRKVVPSLQKLNLSSANIDDIISSKVDNMLNVKPMKQDKRLSVKDDIKINKDIAQSLYPIVSKHENLIDLNIDTSNINTEELGSLINYTAMRVLKDKNYNDTITKKGAIESAKNILAKIIKEDPTKLKDFKKMSKIIPPKNSLLNPVKIDEVARKENLDEMLKDSVVKTRVYRGITNMIDTDYEIGFAVPREMGVHVGNIGQANFILAKALSRKAEDLGIPARLEKDVPLQLTLKDYQDFFVEQGAIAEKLAEKLGTDDIGTPPLAIKSGYINLKKPLKFDTDYGLWTSENLLTNFYEDVLFSLEDGLGRKLNKKELNNLNKLKDEISDIRFKADEDQIEKIMNPKLSTYIDIKERFEYSLMDKKFQNYLKELGFDGIQYRNFKETPIQGEDFSSYILFDANQFKNMSASEYDLTDLREMRYSGGRLQFNEGSKVKTVNTYIIKQGDTLSSIAKKFNTTVENLMEANEIGNINDIVVDESLNISSPIVKNKAINALKNIKDKRINDKAINAVKNLKSKRSKIDWDFISEQEDSLRTLEAVVPMPEKSESGVTVSTGYDLGARKVEDLKRLPKSLQEKLIPYLGLKKEKAVEFLKLNPLKLTDEEYDIIKETIHKEVEAKLRRMWEEDTGTLFSSLPKGKATILASITTQYGNMKTKTPNAWKQATSGDWKAFAENLKDFKDDFGPRRIRELEFWINSDTQDYLNSIGEEDLAARQSLIKDSEKRSKFSSGKIVAKTPLGKGFFSALEEAVDNLKTKKGSGKTFYNELKKKPFVTQDELEYSEIMDQLFMRPNLTKDEVKKLVSRSTPKIIFKDSRNDFEPEYEEWTILQQKTNPDSSKNDEFINNLKLKETEEIRAEFPDGPPTLNEYMRKINDDADLNPAAEIDKYDDPRYNDAFFGAENKDDTALLLDSLMASLPFKNTNYREIVAQFPDVGKFKNMRSASQHHVSVPNHVKNFMHIRLSEGYDENKVSYSIIEEMQSDYHTEGRLSGYAKHDEDINRYVPSEGEIISLQDKIDKIINKNEEFGDNLDPVELDDMKLDNVVFKNNDDPELPEFINNLVYYKAIPEKSSINLGIAMLNRLGLDSETINNLLVERAKAVKDFIKDRPRFPQNVTTRDIDVNLSNYLFARVKEIAPRTVKNYYDLSDESKASILNILSDFDMEGFSTINAPINSMKVKEAPFKDTWHKLAINKSVIDAVDKGDDGIALTLGKTHTERYGEDFGEKFDVLYDQKGKSYLKKLAKKYGLTVEIKPLKIRSDNEMFEDIDETFYVLKFNDKLKKDVLENGLPQFAEGGLVNAD